VDIWVTHCVEFKAAMDNSREILVVKSDSFELPSVDQIPEKWRVYADVVLAPALEYVVQRFRATVEKIEKYYLENKC
jgi:hypothetical protein